MTLQSRLAEPRLRTFAVVTPAILMVAAAAALIHFDPRGTAPSVATIYSSLLIPAVYFPFWAAMDRAIALPIRLAMLAIPATVFVSILGSFDGIRVFDRFVIEWTFGPCLLMLIVYKAVAWFAGWQIVTVRQLKIVPPNIVPPNRGQTTLRAMFRITAIAALGAALASNFPRDAVMLVGMFLLVAPIGLAAVWAGLSTTRFWLRCLIQACAIAIPMGLIAPMARDPRYILAGVFILASPHLFALFLRLGGLRLITRWHPAVRGRSAAQLAPAIISGDDPADHG